MVIGIIELRENDGAEVVGFLVLGGGVEAALGLAVAAAEEGLMDITGECFVGMRVVGARVGTCDGALVDLGLGSNVGEAEGRTDGDGDGLGVGCIDGRAEGFLDARGAALGAKEGFREEVTMTALTSFRSTKMRCTCALAASASSLTSWSVSVAFFAARFLLFLLLLLLPLLLLLLLLLCLLPLLPLACWCWCCSVGACVGSCE